MRSLDFIGKNAFFPTCCVLGLAYIAPLAPVPCPFQQVKDVDPVPPDDDLGFLELDVRDVLPPPYGMTNPSGGPTHGAVRLGRLGEAVEHGDGGGPWGVSPVWEQWVPLKRGGGGEVLLRVARVEPSPLGRGLYELPGWGGGGEDEEGAAWGRLRAARQGRRAAVVAAGAVGVGVVSVGPAAGPRAEVLESASDLEGGVEAAGARLGVQQVLLESFTEQVRVRMCVGYGGVRVRSLQGRICGSKGIVGMHVQSSSSSSPLR